MTGHRPSCDGYERVWGKLVRCDGCAPATERYEARVMYTIPTQPKPTHVMSAPLATPADLEEFVQAISPTTWCYETVEYHGDVSETGAPHDPAYDLYCYAENACPACGCQIEHDEPMPSMLGSGWDHSEHCPNGCRITYTNESGSYERTATRLGAAW